MLCCVFFTRETSLTSVTYRDRISCVAPSFVLHSGQRDSLCSLMQSILAGMCRVYALCPSFAPAGLGFSILSALIFRALRSSDTVWVCLALNSVYSCSNSSNSFSSFLYFFFSSSKASLSFLICLSFSSILFQKNYLHLFSNPFNGNIHTTTVPASVHLLFQHLKASKLDFCL